MMLNSRQKKLEWYEQLGFYRNPFTIKPAAFHDAVLGYESKLIKLNLSIRIGGAWFISGAYGSGKTSVLRHILRKLKKKKKIIYYSLNRKDKTLDIKRLLIKKADFFQRMFFLLPKNIILLIDEADAIDEQECKAIVDYYEQGNIKSLILAADNFEKAPLIKKLRQLIGENLLDLNVVSKDVAVEIVRKRIGNLDFLSDNMIKKLFERSEQNPRKFLENCEDVCRLAVEKGAKKVTLQHLRVIE